MSAMAAGFDGEPIVPADPEQKIRKVLGAKLRKAFRAVQHGISTTIHKIKDSLVTGTKAVGAATRWSLVLISKVPHYLGLGVELAGKMIAWFVNGLLLAVAMLIILAILLIWGAIDLVFWLLMVTLGLLSTLLSTPYHALVGGWDAVKASWYQFGHLFLRPFRSLRFNLRNGKQELKNFFTTPEDVWPDAVDTRLTYEQAYAEAYPDVSDMRPITTDVPSRKKDGPTPKRPPQGGPAQRIARDTSRDAQSPEEG